MSVKAMYDAWWSRFGWLTHQEKGFRQFQDRWFLERFDLDWAGFQRLVQGKTVLEVGTGASAFVATLLRAGAREVVGVDISEGATKIGRMAWAKRREVSIVRADFTRWMDRDGGFDVVIADQTLHHMPDTYQALTQAVAKVKPGGTILFYVYRWKGNVREHMDDWIRWWTTRMRVDDCVRFSEALCWLGRFLTCLSLPLQRFVYWNLVKCFWNPEWSFDNCVRNIYDWYYVPVAHRHRPDEVKTWVKRLGLDVDSFRVEESGISVRARRT